MLHRLPMNEWTNETRLVSLWGFLRPLVARCIELRLIPLTRALRSVDAEVYTRFGSDSHNGFWMPSVKKRTWPITGYFKSWPPSTMWSPHLSTCITLLAYSFKFPENILTSRSSTCPWVQPACSNPGQSSREETEMAILLPQRNWVIFNPAELFIDHISSLWFKSGGWEKQQSTSFFNSTQLKVKSITHNVPQCSCWPRGRQEMERN